MADGAGPMPVGREGGDPVPGGVPRSALADELLLGLELAGLAAFAFSRTVLDAFGRSPESFVVRGASGAEVVTFGFIVALVPALVVAAPGTVARIFGARHRLVVHMVLVATVGGVAAWQLGQAITGWAPDSERLVAAGVVAGAALTAARWRWPTIRTWLRWAGAASAMFLVQFLVFSPSADLLAGATAGGAEADEVAAQLGDSPPDVLFVVFDALPVASLLDGQGHIDPAIYPNFAALAAESTWYRNNTAVAAYTLGAVPALLTGQMPATTRESPDGGRDHNLFTLLGGSYDLHVRERVTRLCPTDLCPPSGSGGLTALLGDAADLWRRGVARGGGETEFELPGIESGRDYVDGVAWWDEQQLDSRGPDLVFQHVIMPHEPWTTAPDGRSYRATLPPTGYFANSWSSTGTEVARQRHVLNLQAADRLLGHQLETLRRDGTYDDTLIVVTADHGASFLPRMPSRGLAKENLEQIMWTPLLVKSPGQDAGAVDDRDIRSVDLLPLVADELGVGVPWSIDGVSPAETARRDGHTKPFDDDDRNRLRSDDGSTTVHVDVTGALDRVLAADPVPWTGPGAVWKRTAHGDLFGRSVDELTIAGDGRDAGTVVVDELEEIEGSTPDRPYAEVVGGAELPVGTIVAYALNGTIVAVTAAEDRDGAVELVHGLVPPDRFREGGNVLSAYEVTGPVGGETLLPLTVRSDG